jgi:hypothetical protein
MSKEIIAVKCRIMMYQIRLHLFNKTLFDKSLVIDNTVSGSTATIVLINMIRDMFASKVVRDKLKYLRWEIIDVNSLHLELFLSLLKI